MNLDMNRKQKKQDSLKVLNFPVLTERRRQNFNFTPQPFDGVQHKAPTDLSQGPTPLSWRNRWRGNRCVSWVCSNPEIVVSEGRLPSFHTKRTI